MDRVTIRLPEAQIADIDQLVEDDEFPNRSEVVRAGVRELLNEHCAEVAANG